MTSRCRFMTSSYLRTFLRRSKFCDSTCRCALAIARVTSRCVIGTSSGRLNRSIRLATVLVANIRMRSSSRDRKNLDSPGSPCRPERPRSWLSIRRDSCRSVPSTHSPPSCTTLSCSAATSPVLISTSDCSAWLHASGSISSGSMPLTRSDSCARYSTLPPSMMSTPRPAMLVATVTAPSRPACAMMCASRSWCLALSTLCLMPLRDFFHQRRELRLLGLVDDVRMILADHRAVRRDLHHTELVDVVELRLFGLGRTRHPRQLVVQPEVVLQRDGGVGLVLLFVPHAFLGLDRLVQPLGVPPALQHSAGELVHDEHLTVTDDVVPVSLVQLLRPDRVLQVLHQGRVQRVVEVLDAQRLLDGRHTLLVDRHGVLALVHLVVDVTPHPRSDPGELLVPAGALLGRAGDDQRGPRLVHEDRVDLVHDGEVVAALDQLVGGQRHVVPQV